MQDLERTLRGLPYEPVALAAASSAPVNAWAAALAGGLALPLAVGLMHPLDTVRTSMQLSGAQGFQESLRALLRGRQLLRGFGASFAAAAPQGAIRMASYESCKERLGRSFEVRSFGVAVSAVAADLASSVVKVPRELVTQRMQTGHYASSSEAVRQIWMKAWGSKTSRSGRQEGLRGLFHGYLSTATRDTPFMVLLFFSYEQFKATKRALRASNRGFCTFEFTRELPGACEIIAEDSH